MNIASRVCTAVMIVAWIPVFAQETPREPAPTPREEVSKEDVQREVDEAVDAIRGYSVERREEAVVRAREVIAAADRRVDRLQAQFNERRDRMSAAARARSEAAMIDVRKRRNEVAEWTGGLRHSSSEAWNEVRTGFLQSYHSLAESLRKARTQFERDQRPQDTTDEQKTSAERQQEEER